VAEFSTSIDIDAAPDVVFDFLVTADGMTSWMGEFARLDPRAGGEFAVDIAGYAVRGEYLHLDRPHRVVVSWGMAGVPELDPGSTRVEFLLTPVGAGARVDLTHSELPDVHVPGHADGWHHFADRLRAVGHGGDPGPDDWSPTGDRDQEAS